MSVGILSIQFFGGLLSRGHYVLAPFVRILSHRPWTTGVGDKHLQSMKTYRSRFYEPWPSVDNGWMNRQLNGSSKSCTVCSAARDITASRFLYTMSQKIRVFYTFSLAQQFNCRKHPYINGWHLKNNSRYIFHRVIKILTCFYSCIFCLTTRQQGGVQSQLLIIRRTSC